MIDHKKLLDLVSEGKSQQKIAEILSTTYFKVRNYYKQYNVQTVRQVRWHKTKEVNGEKTCSWCDVKKRVEEFNIQNKNTGTRLTICKKCSSENNLSNKMSKKVEMVKYKGSECLCCKIRLTEDNSSIFDFHHRDPSEKDINLVKIKGRSWKRIVVELDKCDLLCANCHRLVHAKLHKGRKEEECSQKLKYV